MAAVIADTQNARHLAVDADGRQLPRVDLRVTDTGLDALADRLELVLRILLHSARCRLLQSRFAKCQGQGPTAVVEQRRLGSLRSDVDAE